MKIKKYIFPALALILITAFLIIASSDLSIEQTRIEKILTPKALAEN